MYLHDWKDTNYQGLTGKDALIEDFRITDKELRGYKILLASYTYHDYSGDAYVLLQKDDKLFEVHGSHCSCYGLEGQWELEDTTLDSIKFRLDRGELGQGYYNEFEDELRQVVKKLDKANK